MVLSKTTRIVLIITAAVLVLGLAAMTVWSGSELDLVEALGAVGPLVAGVLAGLGIASGRGSAAALLLVGAVGLTACSGAQRPSDESCVTAHTIVDALDAGLHAADEIVGDQGGEQYRIARAATLGAVDLGQVAVDGCDLARDGAGWQSWVAMALEAAMSLAATIDGAGPADIAAPVPAELSAAIEMLQRESSAE